MKLFENKITFLTEYEAEVVNFINQKPSDFINYSINRIASECMVSTGVISRLYNKLGFNSLRDLQFFVHYQLLSNNYINENSEQKTIKKFASEISNSYIYTFNKIIENINNNIFETIIQKILNTKQIYIFGSRQSYTSCQLLSKKMQQINIFAIFEKSFPQLIHKIKNLNSEALFIIFSHSGNSKEIDFLINSLQSKKYDFIIITGNFDKFSYHEFVISYELNDIWINDAMNSLISHHFIIDLIVEYIKKRKNIHENDELLKIWNKL
ncbi:MurR/RpiR family transcriptional regulator [Mycoplasma iguanae]|uniref:MurR/RpiR family transcriptional regulator n=1 Tax=Mycoplasma iguanae TaxID=292461 RepID=A0ABY5R7U6_9MOLU|nr:MurR/RpiR family transcriptional regulator [Mycoplasma iguanae]UVD81559.1 MurR/RpiR family transcriptional regulator [Mycoplasma iguanae]